MEAKEEKNQEKNQEPKEKKPIQQAKPEEQKRPANCPVCNKSIKKKWYYRNGSYYCGRNCWKQASKKVQAENENPKAAPA